MCSHETHASFGLPESITQTASRSVQPLLNTSRQSVVGHARACPFPQKIEDLGHDLIRGSLGPPDSTSQSNLDRLSRFRTANSPYTLLGREYKHSLTFRVRRYVVIATKPVHLLQIRRIMHNYRVPLPFPRLHPGPCNSVGMRRGTDRHTDIQTAVTNIHFASATPHAECNDNHKQPKFWELRFKYALKASYLTQTVHVFQ